MRTTIKFIIEMDDGCDLITKQRDLARLIDALTVFKNDKSTRGIVNLSIDQWELK